MARRATTTEDAETLPSVGRDRRVFAENLKRLRSGRGLTQVQLAEHTGITQGHYSQLENGNWEPRLATILALAKALRVQPGELLPVVDLDE